MASNAPRTVTLRPLPNRYGTKIPERRLRRWTTARLKAVHRVKNGVNDTYSYFHLVDELANLRPWDQFSSAQLADWLNGHRPTFIWDSVTVGRILNDLIETFNEVNPGPEHQPLTVRRTWSGTMYELQDYEPARVVLLNLLDDLAELSEEQNRLEEKGIISPRLSSPLTRCPSLGGVSG